MSNEALQLKREREELERKFSRFDLDPDSGILILDGEHARQFLDEGVRRGLEVLGMDAFKLFDDGGIQPFMEHSPNFSGSQLSNSERAEACKKLIKTLEDQGFSFEIVLGTGYPEPVEYAESILREFWQDLWYRIKQTFCRGLGLPRY